MNIKEEIYEISRGAKNNFRYYEDTVRVIEEKLIHQIEGEISAKYYDVFRQLSDSINNAGHEKRRGNQIDLINKTMEGISTEFEEFLP